MEHGDALLISFLTLKVNFIISMFFAKMCFVLYNIELLILKNTETQPCFSVTNTRVLL